jgi:hypothetical protein
VCDVKANTLDISSCALHNGCWAIIPNPASQISVIIVQINSVIEEYDLENVSGSCKHQHSLSAREAFSATPSQSRKYSNFILVRGLVRTSTTCSSVERYCTSTAFLCTMSNCALQVSQHMLRSNPVCLSRLTHKLAKCTHCIASIWSSVNQIHR